MTDDLRKLLEQRFNCVSEIATILQRLIDAEEALATVASIIDRAEMFTPDIEQELLDWRAALTPTQTGGSSHA